MVGGRRRRRRLWRRRKKNKKKIRDRTTSVLEKASHPLEAVAAKRKQKRATLFEKLENYDEERINRRTELLEKLRERYAERRKKKKKKEEEEDKEEEEKEDETTTPPTTSALATAAAKKFKEQDFPTLSPDALDAVVEDMRNGKDKFSMTDAMCIISGATVLFSREPNVCRVYSHEDEDGFVIVSAYSRTVGGFVALVKVVRNAIGEDMCLTVI